MNRKRIHTTGFSLLELMVTMAILTLVMGVVFQQINSVQRASKTEDSKLDLSQEGREFVDQFVRDVHQAGYPNAGLFAGGVIASPPENDSRNAVGLVKFAYDEVWLEADVNGDGTIDSIDYKVQPASGTSNDKCPCKISRGWTPKVNGVAPTSQAIAYTVELQDVANSGGANGGASGAAGYALYGSSHINAADVANDSLYATYKSANVFTAYTADGTSVAPADFSTSSGRTALATIKTIRINLNLLARTADQQSGRRPVITLSASGKVGNN